MRWSTLLLTAAATAAISPSARAQVVTESAGTSYNTAALTTSNATSRSMVGMTMTGYDTNGGVVTAVWGDVFGNGAVYGSVNSMFNIFVDGFGSTANDKWRLRSSATSSLSRLTFHGATGNTVFDRYFGAQHGTPGSNGGIDFVILFGDQQNTTATYRNAVGVGGSAPLGDLFESLDLTFGTPLAPNVGMDFYADTDNAAVNSPIVAVVATPEPATFGLLATGLLAIGVVRRRQRRS